MSTTPAAKPIKFACKQCQFNITRTEKDINNDCPKCHVKNPYVSPDQAKKIDETKKLTAANSKAERTSTATCPSAPNGEPHTYALGSCKYCKKSEGSLEDKPREAGATAYAGGQADCPSGGKHMFKFSKCSKCQLSELEYTKQQKGTTTTSKTVTTVKPTPSTPAKSTTTTPSKPAATTPTARSTTTTPAKPTATTTPSKSTTSTSTTPKPTTPAVKSTTTTVASPRTTTSTTTSKPIKFECRQCKFGLTRTEKDINNDCPKCFTKKPYVSPEEAKKNDEHKQLMSPNSKATRTSTVPCPSAPNGEPHTYSLGSCKFCKKAEGAIEDKPREVGATAYAGGQADCSAGGKHMFKFSKCSKCQMSELEYTKQQKGSTTTSTTPKVAPKTATTRTSTTTPSTPAKSTTPSTPAKSTTTTTPAKSTVTTPRSTTPAVKPTTTPKPTTSTTTKPTTPAASTSKPIKFECRQCKFALTRTEKDINNDCPKCFTKKPYVSPEQAKKNDELKQLMSPNSKATRTSTVPCPSAPNGEPHTYSLGSCKFCKKAEGAIEDKPREIGATAYAGGQADCSTGGKHMFKFSKCSKCGISELEYTKQKRASTTGGK